MLQVVSSHSQASAETPEEAPADAGGCFAYSGRDRPSGRDDPQGVVARGASPPRGRVWPGSMVASEFSIQPSRLRFPVKKPLEKTIVAKIKDVAEGLGYWVAKIHGNQYQLKGLPDLLCIKDGKAAWIEVKVPGNEPTRIQEHRMRELAAAGCAVTVAYSATDARHFLEAI